MGAGEIMSVKVTIRWTSIPSRGGGGGGIDILLVTS